MKLNKKHFKKVAQTIGVFKLVTKKIKADIKHGKY